MKKLTRLNEKQFTYTDQKDVADTPTYRALLQIGLGRVAPKSAEESLNLHLVLKKLRGEEDAIELENEEFKIAKDILGKNETRMPMGSHGPLMDYLIEAEKASEKKPELEVK